MARKPGRVSPTTLTPRWRARPIASAAWAGRDVHHVERHAHDLGHGHGAEGRLALQLRRPGERVAARAGDAARQQLGLQIGDELAVLRVHLRQRAELAAAAEACDDLLVAQHEPALVGEEELVARDAVRPDERLHLGGEALAPPRDRHVQPVVDRRARRPGSATAPAPRAATGSAPGRRSRGWWSSLPAAAAAVPERKSSATTVPIVGSCMCVWGSTPPGMHEAAARVDDRGARPGREAFAPPPRCGRRGTARRPAGGPPPSPPSRRESGSPPCAALKHAPRRSGQARRANRFPPRSPSRRLKPRRLRADTGTLTPSLLIGPDRAGRTVARGRRPRRRRAAARVRALRCPARGDPAGRRLRPHAPLQRPGASRHAPAGFCRRGTSSRSSSASGGGSTARSTPRRCARPPATTSPARSSPGRPPSSITTSRRTSSRARSPCWRRSASASACARSSATARPSATSAPRRPGAASTSAGASGPRRSCAAWSASMRASPSRTRRSARRERSRASWARSSTCTWPRTWPTCRTRGRAARRVRCSACWRSTRSSRARSWRTASTSPRARSRWRTRAPAGSCRTRARTRGTASATRARCGTRGRWPSGPTAGRPTWRSRRPRSSASPPPRTTPARRAGSRRGTRWWRSASAAAPEPLAPGALGDVVVREDGRVRHTIVGGRLVVEDGRLVSDDLDAIAATAEREASRLWQRMASM